MGNICLLAVYTIVTIFCIIGFIISIKYKDLKYAICYTLGLMFCSMVLTYTIGTLLS